MEATTKKGLRPGVYQRGRALRCSMPGEPPAGEPVAELEEGVRFVLDEHSYLDISLDAIMGEIGLYTSGSGTESLLTRANGSGNGMALRIERRSGSVYLGQAPEPAGVVAARERLDELSNIRVALANAGQRHEGGLTPERCADLAEAMNNILTGRK